MTTTTQPQQDLPTVTRNGYELVFVEEQTHELCLAAVKQTGYAVKHVLNQTHELCLGRCTPKRVCIKVCP